LVVPETGPLTIALTGDTVLGRPLTPSDRDGAFDAVVQLVRGATVAVTNLETTLLGDAIRRHGGPGLYRRVEALRSRRRFAQPHCFASTTRRGS